MDNKNIDNVNEESSLAEPNIKKPKRTLKAWQKVVLSLFLIPIIFFVLVFGIALVITFNDSNTSSSTEEYTTTIYQTRFEWEEGEDDYVETDLTPISIKLDDTALNDFESYLEQYEVDYDYADAYKIPEAQAYMDSHTVNSTTHKQDVRVNGVLESDSFYKQVKKNNKAFMGGDQTEAAWYEEYSNGDLKKYCEEVVSIINAIHTAHPEYDMDTLCCYLYDLKILDSISALDFAAVELDKKILHINEDMIESWADLRNEDDMASQVLHHECMHLFQVACDCNQSEGELRIGISHEYDALDINPFRWYWLAESGAEMNACDMLNMDYVTYKYKIGYNKTFNYILNLGNNTEVAQLEDLYFDRNADIYAMFDLNESEKQEFIKMMYSLEIMQQEPPDFTKWYQAEYGVDFIDNRQEQIKMTLCLKEDMLTSLAKLFYRNLARCVNEGEVSLQDVYYLMRIFECDFQFHMSNDEVAYMVSLKDLFPKYLDIRGEFLNTLASQNGMTKEQLESGFASYSTNAKSGDQTLSPNCTLAFLTDEQRQAVVSFGKEIYKKGYPNMTEANETCQEWLIKAPYEGVVFDE